MARKVTGERTLSGTHAGVWFNGLPIFEVKKIEAKVTAEREDVQFGLSVDSKITKLKGEGTMTVTKVYTRYEEIRKAWNRGEDTRCEIMANLSDPDAVGKQSERYSIGNVWLNELPVINWEKGAIIEEEVGFGFTPEDLQCLDKINVI